MLPAVSGFVHEQVCVLRRSPMRDYILGCIVMLFLAISPALGQVTHDLQGVWTNNTLTPLQRPKELGGKEFYTDSEIADAQKKQRERLALDYAEGEPPANHSGVPGAPAEFVHYDHAQFGLDWLQSTIAWSRRTSLIVGPEGTIPPLTEEARKRRAEAAARQKGHEFDGAENRPLGARCMARDNVGPPLLPTRYNSNFRIAQSPGYV